MTPREELELILTLIKKHSLPLSPILEYAIKEKLSVSRFISKALGLSSMVRIRKEMEEERKKSETKQ